MVSAKESNVYQQISARDSSNPDQMALLQSRQNYILPPLLPLALAADFALAGQSVSELPHSNSEQDAVARFLKPVVRCSSMSHSTTTPYLKDVQCALPRGHVISNKANDTPGASRRSFLIFDQSGNQMNVFFIPSPPNQIFNGPYGGVAAQVDHQSSMEPIAEETWDENHLADEEVEMPEDAEEIDALLYSDSDEECDNNDNNDVGNDEVTNTRHPPFIIGEGYNKDKSLEELMEEVASSDESPKRRRLLNGQYKKSSLASTESFKEEEPISPSCQDDVESSCAGDHNSYDDTDSSMRLKKVKIRQALKTLDSIIPGLNSGDPLSIIDKAILYLKSMKTEAEALGLSLPGFTSASPPFHGLGAVGRAESLVLRHGIASQEWDRLMG